MFTLARALGLVVLCSGACALSAADKVVDPALLKNVESARQRLDGLVGFLNDTSMAPRLAKLYEEHAKAGAAAVAYLFDNKTYPVPAKASTGWQPGKDKQPGQDEMEKLVSVAIVRHNELLGALCAALRGSPESLGEKKPTSAPLTEKISPVEHYGFLSARGAVDGFLRAFASEFDRYQKARAAFESAGGADTPASEAKTIHQALGALAQARYSDAASSGEKLSGLEERFFSHLCGFHVLAWNQLNPNGHTPAEAKGVELLNIYRIALGLHPVAQNAKLSAMADDYANEMAKKGFFGHVHPSDPTRKTMGDRAKRVDYNAIGGENIAPCEAESAVWMWRADAGHHRNLVTPSFTELAIGTVKASVLNAGHGNESAVTELFGGRGGKKKE